VPSQPYLLKIDELSTMNTSQAEIKLRGKTIAVQSMTIEQRTVVLTGQWVKVAVVKDEDFVEGEVVSDPGRFVASMRQAKLGADIFAFPERIPNTTPRHSYYFEWDNAAAIPITTYDEWWKERVSHELRRDVNRAKKRGVEVRIVSFDDEFVRGVMDIYNESSVRQGRQFWHYGKDFAAVKGDLATYPERSEFIGAYHEGALIGYLKIVYVDRLARLMQIISKIAHQDKRPTNALIATAVQICETRNCTHLTYGRYIYDNNSTSSLTQFKHRNGFEQILFPRYYAPLTAWGRIALGLKLHRGVKGLLPQKALGVLLRLRRRVIEQSVRPSKPSGGGTATSPQGQRVTE
jgi:hypothetical protein